MPNEAINIVFLPFMRQRKIFEIIPREIESNTVASGSTLLFFTARVRRGDSPTQLTCCYSTMTAVRRPPI